MALLWLCLQLREPKWMTTLKNSLAPIQTTFHLDGLTTCLLPRLSFLESLPSYAVAAPVKTREKWIRTGPTRIMEVVEHHHIEVKGILPRALSHHRMTTGANHRESGIHLHPLNHSRSTTPLEEATYLLRAGESNMTLDRCESTEATLSR